MRKILLSVVALGTVGLVVAACSGGGGSGGDPLDHLIVSPDGASIDTATSIHVKATGVTKNGRHVAVTGVTLTPSAGAIDANDDFSDSTAGDVTITATAQGKTGTGTIHVKTAGTATVKVIDATTGTGITGASVSVVGSAGALTDGSGNVTLTNVAGGPVNLTFSATNYYPVTAFGVRVRDLQVPLRPSTAATTGEIDGVIDFTTAYGTSGPPAGSLWLGFAGPSIKGNILAFGLDSLLGPNRPITLGGISLNAPSNVFVYGVTTDYKANAPVGQTAAFALGGEVTLQEITDLISQAGTSDIGAIIAQALPIFNRFYYSVKPGLTITANQTLQNVDLHLDSKLSQIADVQVPTRPVTDPNPLVIAAADLGPDVGFVPVGLNIVDGDAGVDSKVHVVPLTGPFAGSTYLFLTVTQAGGTGSGTANQQAAVLTRGYKSLSNIQEPDFLTPPAIASFTGVAATRTFSFPATTGADLTMHTFTKTIGTSGNPADHFEWDVMTAGDATGFTLPMMAGTNGASVGASWTVQTLGLESQTYDALLTPGAPVGVTSYFNDANRLVLTRNHVQ
jgi:hypothetical protein